MIEQVSEQQPQQQVQPSSEPHVLVRQENDDGSWYVALSDGSVSRMEPNGTLTQRGPDGSVTVHDGNGTLRIAFGVLP